MAECRSGSSKPDDCAWEAAYEVCFGGFITAHTAPASRVTDVGALLDSRSADWDKRRAWADKSEFSFSAEAQPNIYRTCEWFIVLVSRSVSAVVNVRWVSVAAVLVNCI